MNAQTLTFESQEADEMPPLVQCWPCMAVWFGYPACIVALLVWAL